MSIDPATGLHRRGTTNGNARGSVEDRRRRREWLVATYAANRNLVRVTLPDGLVMVEQHAITAERLLQLYGPGALDSPLILNAVAVPTCRCYRCGTLLTVDTVTVDRIKPGCEGGTYRRDNIRPACADCNSETGRQLAHERTRAKKAKTAQRLAQRQAVPA